jgi:5-hydroxyisourate hydrolase-like protein (transthyretin family)
VRFFERVALDFRVDDVSTSYHVPLLLGPFAVSSYRGS